MRHNMTEGVEWRQILRFSLPITLGNILQQLYNTVDGIIVGNFVSESALASVGACTSLAVFFLAVSMGLANGTGIMISQLYGAKQYKEVRTAASTSLIILSVVGFVIALIGAVFARGFLGSMLNIPTGNLLDQAVVYFTIYATGLVFQFIYNTVAAILRAIGDSRAILLFLLISTFLNLILDLWFVIGLGWGVMGVATATVISQFICTVVSVLYMIKRHEIFNYTKGEFRFERSKAKFCLQLGIPSMMQQCVISCGNMFLQRLINSFGTAIMAASTIGSRIEGYAMAPIYGFAIGLSNFTGQNIGAGRKDRVERALKQTLVMSASVCACIAILISVFAKPLSQLFGVEGEALIKAMWFIRYFACCATVFAVYIAVSHMLQGAGDVVYTSICSLSSLVVRIALAYTLAYVFNIGYLSVWIPMPFGWTLACALAVARYMKGNWRNKSIIQESL